MKLTAGVLLTIAVSVIVGLVFVYSGFYNVAADSPPGAVEHWLLRTTMTQSVRRHAKVIPVPSVNTPDAIKRGANQYHDMCVSCHGAPGITPDEVGKGLTPQPPDLSKTASQWSKQELFWIIKHGIQFTGMPAWGKTHGDEEIWVLATFVEQLPLLGTEQYRSMVGGEVKRSHGNSQFHQHGLK